MKYKVHRITEVREYDTKELWKTIDEVIKTTEDYDEAMDEALYEYRKTSKEYEESGDKIAEDDDEYMVIATDNSSIMEIRFEIEVCKE